MIAGEYEVGDVVLLCSDSCKMTVAKVHGGLVDLV